VNRIVAMFPSEEQEIARLRLSEALQAVISQRLLPRADGHGRVPALEIMICTSAVRDLIKDADRTPEVQEYMRDGREQHAMQTFDQHLMDLVAEEIVAYEAALAAATNPDDLERQVRAARRRSRTPAEAGKPAPAPPAPPASRPSG
jgi:twitching motility protein PilT